MNDAEILDELNSIAIGLSLRGDLHHSTTLKYAAARLAAVIATDWRSVQDEAPGLEVKVDGYGLSGLDYHTMRRVMVVYRDHSGRYMEDRGAHAFPAVITHWRPRPAPPKPPGAEGGGA